MSVVKEKRLILWFEEVGMEDVPLVGGKNASLGEMIRALSRKGIRIPAGFAITAYAYRHFLKQAGLETEIRGILADLNVHDLENLSAKGKRIRDLIVRAPFPSDLGAEIVRAYRKLCDRYGGKEVDVAVRSSATAEDLPEASFAGQQETFLNIKGEYALLEACRKCFASLFTNRAISYRQDMRIGHFDVALSVGVQKMVRSDAACAGVAFTLDTESGFPDVVYITGGWGLGENVVQGKVNPDEFYVHKPTLKKGFRPIVGKRLGDKRWKMVYTDDVANPVQNVPVPKAERERYVLSDDEILELSRWSVLIEEHYGKPMDIEWAKDGDGIHIGTGLLFVVQARPETVQSQAIEVETYVLDAPVKPEEILVKGVAVGAKVGKGLVKVIEEVGRIREFAMGEVLVTDMTDPDWEPIMKLASAIVTNRGGRTSHAAIVSRELGIPCIIGTEVATKVLKDGMEVTVDCTEGVGRVLKGLKPFHIDRLAADEVPNPKTEIMLLAGIPEQAFLQARYPQDGVGLAREEFILSSSIGIHPLALLDYDHLKARAEEALRRAQAALSRPDLLDVHAQDQEAPRRLQPASLPLSEEERELQEVVKAIEKRTAGYIRKADFFVEELARGIARIAAAFYREEDGKVQGDVIVRLTDFKSNEYRSLMGGRFYEPLEQNPMLGWRGASRYYHPAYEPAFALECQALKKVRDEMGLTNVKVMVPFCRTVEEGRRVIETMKKYNLVQGENGLEIYVMAEIPSNVILADEFARIFDGFSIGSNDLTQLTLGLDRDSELVQSLYDERNEAVKRLLAQMLKAARGHRPKRKTGICGQAPSDFPSMAAFLVEHGIDSMAVNTDTVVNTRILVYFAELAKEEGRRLVYTEERDGKTQVKLGVSPPWLKAKAERWVKAHVQRAQDLPREERVMIATLLHAMAPKVQLDHPGGKREILCFRLQDVDLAKEERARGVKTVDVRPVGSLTARGIVRKADQWMEQARALGQKVALMENPAQVKELIKKFDEAHREFLAQKFTDIILEMYQNEVKKT